MIRIIPFQQNVRMIFVAAVSGLFASSSGVVAAQTDELPVVEFTDEGLGLVEAVRLTLVHEPNIKLAEQASNFSQGISQEQTGAFDATLLGSVFYEYRQQELAESRKQIERDKRQRLDRGIQDNLDNRQAAQDLLDALRRVQSSAPGENLDAIPDPEIRAELEVIDILIRQATNPTAAAELLEVRRRLLADLISRLNEGLEAGLDGFQQAVNLRENLGDAPDDEVFYNGTGDVQISKLYRNGMVVQPFLNGRFEGTNFKGKLRDADFGGKGLQDLFTFRVGANLSLPLMRGRGNESTAAGEMAAQKEYDAAIRSQQYQSTVSVLNTVLAYWDLRGAEEGLTVLTRSVDLQRQITELTEASIEAGELPRVEISRVRASEARARARLQDSLRRLHQARVQLALVIGLAVEGNTATLPSTADGFPGLGLSEIEDADLARLINDAWGSREDLAASLFQEDAGRILERRAETDLKPVLDVNSSVWATALDERTVSRAIDRWVGPSVNVAIDFEKPLGNNIYKGRHAQARADLQQRIISVNNLRREIQLAIVRTARSLKEAAERVRLAGEAVQFYRETVEAEIERFRAGESTLIDTILTEDLQTQARLAEVAAAQEWARLVAELRFQAGSLVQHAGGASAIRLEDLTTPPFPGTTP